MTNYVPYDKVVFCKVFISISWNGTFPLHPREQRWKFTIPHGNSMERNVLQALIDGIKEIGLDTSAGYESRLIIPNPTFFVSSCNSSSNVKLHITIPKTTDDICIGLDQCRQVMCLLGANDLLDRTDVSYVPGNAQLFFGNSTQCVIQKPPLWDDYVTKHFGNATNMDRDWYLFDLDGDG